MEKVIKFSPEEKNLIYNRFVAPSNGTADEAMHFVDYCETLGLNPLLGDVVFQKFETKYGPKVSFVSTRDGLMRVAVRDENYVGPPISNVVRDGDHFEFLPADGTVIHKFGTKRGKILGAYAVLYHKTFRPYACWVEFSEYFNANASSAGGKSFIWDKYPSAMIEKVAETFALKRQFPAVGGLTTEEEIGMDINLPQQMEGLSFKDKTPPQQQQHENPQHQPNNDQQTPQSESKLVVNKANEQTVTTVNALDQEQTQWQEVAIEAIEIGKSPSGVKFGKISTIKSNGQRLLVLAKGEDQVSLVKDLENGQNVLMDIVEENGFHFVKGVRASVH